MAQQKAPPPPPARKRKRGSATREIELKESPTLEQARMRAMFLYLRNPGLSIREIWEHFRMDEDDESPYIKEFISWATLARRATAQKWRQRRDEHWHDIERRVLLKLKTSAVQREIDEIATLETVMEHAVSLTTETKPKSLEGLLNAIINLDKRMAGKRDRIAAHAAEAGVNEDTGDLHVITVESPSVVDQFTDEEIEEMAVAMAKRRAGMIEDKHGEE